MKKLVDVESFGGIDADTDELLDTCFQSHDAYLRAKDHQHFLIIGRKGSGKTAIFRKLITTRHHDVFTFGHTFSDYPWHHHDAQAVLGVPEEDRYTHSWKYLILLTTSKILLNSDQSQPWSEEVLEDIGKLESFVVDSYGSRDPDLTQLFVPSKTLRVNPTLGIPFTNLKIGVSIERVAVSDLPKIVQDVNRTIAASVIRALNPKYDYYVCFDQLDLGFDAESPKYSQRLTGLILAARELSQLARAGRKRFSVAIFLRDDIYQLLRFEDKNKISENHMSRIEWDGEGSDWTLKRLMEERFGAVLAMQPEGSWPEVFDETQEMPGRQTKYQHIRDRTFRRPRDMIKFCNEVLASFKKRGGDGNGRFQNQDVIAARSAYSNYLLNELDDEIFKHVPGYDRLVEVLKSLGTLQFTHGDFAAVVGKRPELLPEGMNVHEALRRLFEFSMIGYLKTGGGGGGSTYVWRYLSPRARFDEAATNFRVHLGFKEVLALKKGGGGSDDE